MKFDRETSPIGSGNLPGGVEVLRKSSLQDEKMLCLYIPAKFQL